MIKGGNINSQYCRIKKIMKGLLKRNTTLFYAMSLAATWAWGTSLVVGMETVQTKGWIPFIIWAVANSLAIPLFGFIAYRIPNLDKVVNSKIVSIFTTIVSIFCIWIQLNAIYQYLCNLEFVTDITAKIIAITIMVFMAIALYKNGLIKSIFLDNPLWYLCYGLLIALLICGLVGNVETFNIVNYTDKSEISWALNSCIILFSGPIMSLQNWQMAEKLRRENKMKAHYLAGVLFAIYMLFVGILANFKFNGIMNMLLVFVVLCVALSTADSAIVGIQKVLKKKWGTIVSLIAIACWNWVIPMGVMGLWTTMGNMRKYVAGACIIVAIAMYYIQKRKKISKETDKNQRYTNSKEEVQV